MADTQNINAVTTLQGIDSNDSILVSDGNTSLAKINYNLLAKAVIEQYTGSTLAGSAQSIQSALNTLNSNTYNLTDGKVISENSDFDTLKTPGTYTCNNYFVGNNAPVRDSGKLIVEWRIGSASYLRQTFYPANANNGYAFVREFSATTWSSWVKQPTRAEVDALNSKPDYYSIATIIAETEAAYFSALGDAIIAKAGNNNVRGVFLNVWSAHYTAFGLFQHEYSSNTHRVSGICMFDIAPIKTFNYNAATGTVNVRTFTAS